MRYILTTAIITLIISQSLFAAPTAYDAALPDQMNEGEYVLGYEPGYVNQTKDITDIWAYIGQDTGGNSLLIKQGCTLAAFKNFVVGGYSGGINNILTVQDGELSSTNGASGIWVGFAGGSTNTLIISPDGVISNNFRMSSRRAHRSDVADGVPADVLVSRRSAIHRPHWERDAELPESHDVRHGQESRPNCAPAWCDPRNQTDLY